MTNKEAAVKIIERLRSQGFQALLAGGCVRDMLLARDAKDYDVVTNATPKDVIGLFKRTIKIGAHFGVIMIMLEDQRVEVATFRSDGDYHDGRHPAQVKFVDAKQDAMRRDFTINGMFYDTGKDKVTDYVDGQADLQKQIIRTIGVPQKRFDEDYLRMLRAVRFSTQLKFRIEPKTWNAIKDNAKKISKISGERISMEIESILIDPNRTIGAAMLVKSGLAQAIFHDFTGDQSKFAIKVLAQLKPDVDYSLALAALFAASETHFALEKCVILMLSRNQNKHIKFLLSHRGKLLNEKMSLADLKQIAAEPYFRDLYELQKAIQIAAGQSTDALTKLNRRLDELGDIELRPEPLLNGHELIQAGATPGPIVGQLAEEMYTAQLEGKLQGKDMAKKWVKIWIQQHKQK